MSAGARAEAGSFRDPLSRVYLLDDEVVRGFRGRGVADLARLEDSGFLARNVRDGRIVGTERTDVAPLGEPWEVAVRHERVPVISYPWEWTFGMLRDAALLSLDLCIDALGHGMWMKDATPFNVQFRGAVPVFIDVGSFEAVEPGTPWPGYRQFCEQFLNPLLLQSVLDVPFQPWLRGAMRGITPSELAAVLPRRHRLRRGVLTHVALHARAERRLADTDRDVRGELRRAGFGQQLVLAQLRNLRSAVERLRWRRSESTWSGYSERSHYSSDGLGVKERFVADVVGSRHRRVVWDLGANDGRFSALAARSSDAVVAVDGDSLVVDHLYRQLSSDGDTTTTPLVMDLIDPSPSQGWRGRERPAFAERTRPDVVLALALVHHLAIPGNVPVASIVDWLAESGAEVVLEVPDRDDPMVQRLLRAKREDLGASFDLAEFDSELPRRFDVLRTERLPGGTRSLHHLVPR